MQKSLLSGRFLGRGRTSIHRFYRCFWYFYRMKGSSEFNRVISGTSLKQAYMPGSCPIASVSKVTSHSNYIGGATAVAVSTFFILLSQVRYRTQAP